MHRSTARRNRRQTRRQRQPGQTFLFTRSPAAMGSLLASAAAPGLPSSAASTELPDTRFGVIHDARTPQLSRLRDPIRLSADEPTDAVTDAVEVHTLHVG